MCGEHLEEIVAYGVQLHGHIYTVTEDTECWHMYYFSGYVVTLGVFLKQVSCDPDWPQTNQVVEDQLNF